jgi:hypothetical protein
VRDHGQRSRHDRGQGPARPRARSSTTGQGPARPRAMPGRNPGQGPETAAGRRSVWLLDERAVRHGGQKGEAARRRIVARPQVLRVVRLTRVVRVVLRRTAPRRGRRRPVRPGPRRAPAPGRPRR